MALPMSATELTDRAEAVSGDQRAMKIPLVAGC